MVALEEVIAGLRELKRDGRRFVLKLHIEDTTNKLRPIGAFYPEQLEWIEALLTKQFVLAVKPRQLGFTTLTVAFLFWKALFAQHGRRILSVVHEESALDRLATMTRIFHDNLPEEIRPGYSKNSRTVTELRKVNAQGEAVPGSSLVRALAGGRGQAKGWTFNDLHATEMAFWPSGTSAQRTQEGRSVDEEAFGSAMATIHDPTSSCIVESTGNGPRGLFFDLYQQATTDPKWAFVFQKWTDVPRYSEALSDVERRTLEKDLDAEETKLFRGGDLTLEQLAWRRTKMRTLRMTPITFRRNYPLTDMEPFLLDEHGWYNQEALLSLLKFVRQLGASDESLRVFHPYDKRCTYGIGMDTAGGVGRDEAVIQVVRSDRLHVCTWASNRASPAEQAVMMMRISNMYGRPPATIIEANNHGLDVIERCLTLGVSLWKDEDDGWFWSTGARNGNSKRMACVHMREVVDNEWTVINDAATIRQMQRIVEKPTGQIEATAGHDDRAYAYALALWAIRRHASSSESSTLVSEKDRIKRVLALGTPDGRGGWT